MVSKVFGNSLLHNFWDRILLFSLFVYISTNYYHVKHFVNLERNLSKMVFAHVGRDIEMLVIGHWGYPILLFPTSMGRYYQNKEFGLTDSVRGFVDAGKIKLYLIDGIDEDSWYAKHLPPAVGRITIPSMTVFERRTGAFDSP